MHATENTDQLLDIVGLIYESAMDPSLLQRGLAGFGELVGGSAAQTYTFRRDDQRMISSTMVGPVDEERNRQYVEHWGHLDPRAHLMATVRSGSARRCRDHFDEKFVARNAFYQEFFIPNGFRWALGGAVHFDDGTTTVLAAIRARDLASFTREDVATLERLLPHVKRATVLRNRLDDAIARAGQLDQLVEAMPTPCVLLGRCGQVVACNRQSLQTLAALRAVVHRTRVAWHVPADQEAWERAVAAAGASRLPAVASIGGMRLHVVPWQLFGHSRDAFEAQMYLAYFEDDLDPASAMQRLARRAGLTAAETEVLEMILQGLPAKKIARERGVTLNTTRSQINKVLSKCGASSQREIAAMLYRH